MTTIVSISWGWALLILCPSLITSFKVRKISLQAVDLETLSDDGIQIWQHDGFSHMSGLQINEKWNLKVSVSPKLLMASGESPAHLQTTLKNYEHTFLTIKFSTIIGSVKHDKPTKTDVPYYTTTTTVKPSAENAKMPSVIHPGSTENLEMDDKREKNATVLSPSITEEIVFALQNSSIGSMKNAEADELNDTDEESIRAKREIEISSHELLEIHKIIKMAKKVADSTKSTVKENKTTIVTMMNSSTSTNNANVNDIIELQSKALQTEKSTTTTITTTTTATPTTTTTTTIASKIPKEKSKKAKAKHEDLITAAVDTKLTYKTWRASFDKSYRPPGFYFLVDDQVIFDSWFGMWHRPNVLGRFTPFSVKRTWNETEIQFRWEEPPKKDIKISFEWDPLEKGSYILIDNIEIYTFGIKPEMTSPNTKEKNDNNMINLSGNSNSNNNLTVYIVVKPAPPDEPHQSHVVASVSSKKDYKGDINEDKSLRVSGKNNNIAIDGEHSSESHKEKITADEILKLIKTVHHTNLSSMENGTISGDSNKKVDITSTTPKPQTISTTTKYPKAKVNKPEKKFTDDKTGLIVLIVLIVVSTLILIALLHRKFKEKKNPNKIGGGC